MRQMSLLRSLTPTKKSHATVHYTLSTLETGSNASVRLYLIQFDITSWENTAAKVGALITTLRSLDIPDASMEIRVTQKSASTAVKIVISSATPGAMASLRSALWKLNLPTTSQATS